jgi:hypothetical protein
MFPVGVVAGIDQPAKLAAECSPGRKAGDQALRKSQAREAGGR